MPQSQPKPPPRATKHSHLPALHQVFFARPAEAVAPELIGCLLVKRHPDGELLWGVLVGTESYCQSEPACHGHRRRTPSNETLFGEPVRFYVYLTYGIHHCVNVVIPTQDQLADCLGSPHHCGPQRLQP